MTEVRADRRLAHVVVDPLDESVREQERDDAEGDGCDGDGAAARLPQQVAHDEREIDRNRRHAGRCWTTGPQALTEASFWSRAPPAGG